MQSNLQVTQIIQVFRHYYKMVLSIYFEPFSQPSRSVVLFAKCAGIQHEPMLTSIVKGDHRKEEFLKNNPSGKLPFIDDNGFKLFECSAILRYLCAARKVEDHWYPTDIVARAKIDEYLSWHHANIRLGGGKQVRLLIFNPFLTGNPPDYEFMKHYREIYDNAIKIFENHFIADTKFISSDEISIADIMALTEFTHLQVMGEHMPPVSTKVQEWLNRCQGVTEPYFSDVHKVLFTLRDKVVNKKPLTFDIY